MRFYFSDNLSLQISHFLACFTRVNHKSLSFTGIFTYLKFGALALRKVEVKPIPSLVLSDAQQFKLLFFIVPLLPPLFFWELQILLFLLAPDVDRSALFEQVSFRTLI
jgi:hypothetical protein